MKYKVSPELLMDRLRILYSRAHSVWHLGSCPRAYNVKRVGGAVVASQIEDLLAEFIYANLEKKGLRVFINPTINIHDGGKARKPDILICRKIRKNEFQLVHVVEVKADTGHMRTRKEIAKCLRSAIGLCKRIEREGSFSLRLNNETYNVSVVPPAKIDLVVMTAANNTTVNLESVCEEVWLCSDDRLKMEVLTNECLFDHKRPKRSARPLKDWFNKMMNRVEQSEERAYSTTFSETLPTR